MRTIKHEHLAGISQHDWYVSCHQSNDAVALEDAEYTVVCTEGETFTDLGTLNAWAGY